MWILVVNAGSSSLKLRVLGPDDAVVASSDLPTSGDPEGLGPALRSFVEGSPAVDAVGHRVVHGGTAFGPALVLGVDVARTLGELADLAPLHNPPSLAAIEALGALYPDLAQVACFDTAFHATMPARAATYAVPREWRERWGIRRYGFHGLSHAWASRRAAWLLGEPAEGLRMVTAHVGAGASLAAVLSGRSVDTTMGFTPLEGLVMATRSGSVDPGALLWLQRHAGLGAEEIERVLEHESGLLGLSGVSADLRRVIELADSGDPAAGLAYDVYVHRMRAGVAAMAAAMGGVDCLVFTGGAGEASHRLRQDVCSGLGFLGIALDQARNADPGGDALITLRDAAARVLVVRAREDLEIARQVRDVIGGPPPAAVSASPDGA